MERGTSNVIYQPTLSGWRAYCNECDATSPIFLNRSFALGWADSHSHAAITEAR